MKLSFRDIKKSLLITLALILICGLIYPLFMTGFSQLIFPHQANGSLIEMNGKAVGSELLGQDLTDERFMKCRPSAVGYNTYTEKEKKSGEYKGVASGSFNYAPSNPELYKRVALDMKKFLKANPDIKKEDIPADLMTASGSGLDPHISPASAEIQIPAIAEATGLKEKQLKDIVKKSTTGKFMGIFGEPTVNVLDVNILIAQKLDII